jgi:hypothetical protein
MTTDSHIAQLEMRHRELEAKLHEALSHPSTADDEIAQIKRQKLLIKDRIAELRGNIRVH